MTPQYSSSTRLRDYIAFLLPWAHGHQLKAIGDFVAAIIEQQTAAPAKYEAECITNGTHKSVALDAP
jgi:hypothetical protein